VTPHAAGLTPPRPHLIATHDDVIDAAGNSAVTTAELTPTKRCIRATNAETIATNERGHRHQRWLYRHQR